MQSKNYWIQRALQREADAFQNTSDTVRRLRVIYDMAAARLVHMANKIFASYTKSAGIDPVEAKQLLTVQETASTLAALREEYAKTASVEALAKLNAPAYSYRISRTQALRKAIDAETQWIDEKETQAGAKRLVETYDDAYYKTMHDTAKAAEHDITFSPLPQRSITEALENRWKGENYSERVWKNTHLVAKEAGVIIDAGISSGASVAQMTHDIKDLFDVAAYAAERLVRTEVNRMHNDATLKSYKAMGVDRYTFLATLDARTCSVCGALDGKYFKVAKAQTGVNLPPLHPNDRCTTVAYYPNDDFSGTRIARDPTTGKNYKVDRNVTYEKWRKEITEKYGADSLENAQKRYANLKRDSAEQQAMQKILGKNVPSKIADFQDLKYNDVEKWNKIRLDYKRRGRLTASPDLALPNASTSIADEPKFTRYFFGGNNQGGLSKGAAFTSHLGYGNSNWQDFKKEIQSYAKVNPAKFDHENEHGKYYNQPMVVYGLKNSPMDIMTTWEVNNDKTRFVTAFPNNKGVE